MWKKVFLRDRTEDHVYFSWGLRINTLKEGGGEELGWELGAWFRAPAPRALVVMCSHLHDPSAPWAEELLAGLAHHTLSSAAALTQYLWPLL